MCRRRIDAAPAPGSAGGLPQKSSCLKHNLRLYCPLPALRAMGVQTGGTASGRCLYGAAFLQRRPCARLYSPPCVSNETGFKGRAAKRRDLPQLLFREVVPLQLARQIGRRGVQPPCKLLFGYVHFNQQRIDFFRHHIYTCVFFANLFSGRHRITLHIYFTSPNAINPEHIRWIYNLI